MELYHFILWYHDIHIQIPNHSAMLIRTIPLSLLFGHAATQCIQIAHGNIGSHATRCHLCHFHLCVQFIGLWAIQFGHTSRSNGWIGWIRFDSVDCIAINLCWFGMLLIVGTVWCLLLVASSQIHGQRVERLGKQNWSNRRNRWATAATRTQRWWLFVSVKEQILIVIFHGCTHVIIHNFKTGHRDAGKFVGIVACLEQVGQFLVLLWW